MTISTKDVGSNMPMGHLVLPHHRLVSWSCSAAKRGAPPTTCMFLGILDAQKTKTIGMHTQTTQ